MVLANSYHSVVKSYSELRLLHKRNHLVIHMYSKSGHSSFNDFQPHSAKEIGSGPRGSEDSLFFVTCNDPVC